MEFSARCFRELLFKQALVLVSIALNVTQAEAGLRNAPAPPPYASFVSYHHENLLVTKLPRHSLSMPLSILSASLTKSDRAKVTTIEFHDCDLADCVGVLSLSEFSSLRSIGFYRCHIDSFSFEWVTGSVSFASLYFKECSIECARLNLSHPLKIQTINYHSCSFVGNPAGVLGDSLQCPNLYSMSVTDSQITSTEWISRNNSIVTLSLTGNKIQHIDAETCDSLSNLEYFHLSRNTSIRITFPPHPEKLQWIGLYLVGAQVDNSDLESMAALPMLNELVIAGKIPAGDGLASLSASSSLESLTLESSGLGDEELLQFSEHSKLKSLNIAGSRATDRTLRHLAKLAKLERLNICRTSATEEGIIEIVFASNISVLVYSPTDNRSFRTLRSQVIKISKGRATVETELTPPR